MMLCGIFAVVIASEMIGDVSGGINCAACKRKILENLGRFQHYNTGANIPLELNLKNVACVLQIPFGLGLIRRGEVCPTVGQNGTSYVEGILLDDLTIECNVTTAESKWERTIFDTINNIGDLASERCKNPKLLADMVKKLGKNNITASRLDTSKCPGKLSKTDSTSSERTIEINFSIIAQFYYLKITIISAAGQTHFVAFEKETPLLAMIGQKAHAFHIFSVCSHNDEYCECILKNNFQSSFYESVFSYLLACHSKDDELAPLRKGFTCDV